MDGWVEVEWGLGGVEVEVGGGGEHYAGGFPSHPWLSSVLISLLQET